MQTAGGGNCPPLNLPLRPTSAILPSNDIGVANLKWLSEGLVESILQNNESLRLALFDFAFCKSAMSKGDIYVQLTASSGSTGKSRSVIVLVPRANIERFREQRNDSKSDDHNVAKSLADPLAKYAFTHRLIFSTFEISHSFQESPPSEIKGRSPNISQSGLKAWVVS
jgi:hypothetical protein